MRTLNPVQEITEQEAAKSLGIGLDELYRLLDRHIFNNGTLRPAGLVFTHADLLLLSYWRGDMDSKVIRMPHRR